MDPADYIQLELDKLKRSEGSVAPKNSSVQYICSKINSKKFRKYALDETMVSHIIKVVEDSIKKNVPINFVWVFGGYKLWRIPTSPEVDWAELFSMIYFAKWLKPIVEVYKPGVIFDFYSDDVIVSRMNNIAESDIEAYLKSFQKLLNFFKKYLPSNMDFTFHRVADQYSAGEFDRELEENIIKLKSELPNGLPKIDETRSAMTELNVKLKPGQDHDSLWKEKISLVHDAYAMASKRRPYYRNEEKIMVLNTPVKGVIAVGTTKSSVAKFWCGMGVLEKRGENYYEKIISPKQLSEANIKYQNIAIKGLDGVNFSKIGLIIT